MWSLKRENHGYGYHCHICYKGKRTQFITTMENGKVLLCTHKEGGNIIKVSLKGKNVLEKIKESTINLLIQFDKLKECIEPSKKKCVLI